MSDRRGLFWFSAWTLLAVLMLMRPVPCRADVCARSGNFTRASGTIPYTQVVSYSSGCTPKAVIIASSEQTIGGFTAGMNLAICASTRTASAIGDAQQRCAGVTEASGLGGGSQSGTQGWDRLSVLAMNGASLAEEGYISAWGTSSFTITWVTGPSGTGSIFNYTVYGGSDLSAILVAGLTAPTTNGSKAITGAGFQPDFGFFFGISSTSDTSGTLAKVNLEMGVAKSSSQQWVFGMSTGNATSSQLASSYLSNSYCFALVTKANPAALAVTASHSSWDADGATLAWTNTTGVAQDFTALFMKGATQDVGSFAKNTGAAPVTDTISTAINPVSVFMLNDSFAASSSIQSNLNVTFGSSDGTNSWALYGYQTGGLATTDDERMMNLSNPLAVSHGSTEDALFTNFSISGASFAGTWNPNNSTAVQNVWWAIGAPVTANAKIRHSVTE